MNDFGIFLREIRGKRSLREMEKITGLSHTYLSSLEKGVDPRSGNERKPSPEVLKKLSLTLGIDYTLLMEKSGYLEGTLKRNNELAKELSQKFGGFNNPENIPKEELEKIIEKHGFNEKNPSYKKTSTDYKSNEFIDALEEDSIITNPEFNDEFNDLLNQTIHNTKVMILNPDGLALAISSTELFLRNKNYEFVLETLSDLINSLNKLDKYDSKKMQDQYKKRMEYAINNLAYYLTDDNKTNVKKIKLIRDSDTNKDNSKEDK